MHDDRQSAYDSYLCYLSPQRKILWRQSEAGGLAVQVPEYTI